MKGPSPAPKPSAGAMAKWLNRRSRLLDPAPWRYLARHFKGRGGLLSVVALLGVVQSAVTLPTLLLVRYAFDVAVPRGATPILVLIGGALVLIRLTASLFALLGRVLSLRLTKRAIRDMRIDLLAALYILPRNYFGLNDAAQIQTRIVMETERIDNLTSIVMSSVLPSALGSIILIVFLIYLNPLLVLVLAGLAPVVWLATSFTGKFIKREVRAFQGAFEHFSQGVQFVLRQMDLTRMRGFEPQELERQSGHVKALERNGVRMAMSYAFHLQTQSNLTGLGGLLLLVGGGVAVASHAMSLGALLAFYLAAGLLNNNINSITGVVPDVIAGNESLTKLLALHREEQEHAYSGERKIEFAGRLTMSNLVFGYAGAPLLKDVSLTLTPGQVTAVFGPNGAGKSTLVNLFLGYLTPQSGALSADGIAYADLDIRQLRRSIGIVPQRPTFFTGTIRENVGYGWPDASSEEIQSALRISGAEPFVLGLSDGPDTIIGEGGALVSGGEAQKLAIARALIGRPRLMILDEPTNHLDIVAISQILNQLSRLPNRPGVLIISHDQTVLSFCDRVFNLAEGRLAPIHSNADALAPKSVA